MLKGYLYWNGGSTVGSSKSCIFFFVLHVYYYLYVSGNFQVSPFKLTRNMHHFKLAGQDWQFQAVMQQLLEPLMSNNSITQVVNGESS